MFLFSCIKSPSFSSYRFLLSGAVRTPWAAVDVVTFWGSAGFKLLPSLVEQLGGPRASPAQKGIHLQSMDLDGSVKRTAR